MSGKVFNLDQVDRLALRIASRVGAMEGNGFPWQRKDCELLREAMDMLVAISRHVRENGDSVGGD